MALRRRPAVPPAFGRECATASGPAHPPGAFRGHADKEWYTQYFKDLDPKLTKGGCFTAHNAANSFGGVKEFLDHVAGRPDYRTTIDRSSSAGISISCKK